MWIKSLSVKNFRCFRFAKLQFSKSINLITGQNNGGKSSLLLPISTMQVGLPHLGPVDVRIGEQSMEGILELSEGGSKFFAHEITQFTVRQALNSGKVVELKAGTSGVPTHEIQNVEPRNFIYAFLSNRKVAAYDSQIAPEERRSALEDLGYEFSDDDLWSGWLFLEESSAEKIVREYLIPWFAPKLSQRLRTYSARCVTEIVPKFKDFNDLFVFLHLEPTYKNRVWVVVDGGAEESEILDKLTEMYCKHGWNKSQFRQFKHHNFEKYFPGLFTPQVEACEAAAHNEKPEKKRALLEEVEAWIKQDRSLAETQFRESATEVIALLVEIESAICGGERS
jgi:AAA ATPase-like protein